MILDKTPYFYPGKNAGFALWVFYHSKVFASRQEAVYFSVRGSAAHFFVTRMGFVLMSKEQGIRLYYLRRHKTVYNHSHMAKLLGISRSTYTKYETGQSDLPVYILKKIFNVSYDELIDVELTEEEIADYEMFKLHHFPE